MHPRVIAALGEDLVTSEVVALIELVKNSYDALATRVDVRFLQKNVNQMSIEVQDNGTGMTREIIEDVWSMVATPYRLDKPLVGAGSFQRRVSGEKGLGRLSAARLGNHLEVVTKSESGPCYKLIVNWEQLKASDSIDDYKIKYEEEKDSPFSKTGTILRITDLSTAWATHSITLTRFLVDSTRRG